MSNINRNNYPLEFKVSSAQLAVDSDQPIARSALHNNFSFFRIKDLENSKD